MESIVLKTSTSTITINWPKSEAVLVSYIVFQGLASIRDMLRMWQIAVGSQNEDEDDAHADLIKVLKNQYRIWWFTKGMYAKKNHYTL